MGHEKFLKIFDGPQKNFLSWSFLVTSFKKLAKNAHKMLKSAIKGISEKKDMLK